MMTIPAELNIVRLRDRHTTFINRKDVCLCVMERFLSMYGPETNPKYTHTHPSNPHKRKKELSLKLLANLRQLSGCYTIVIDYYLYLTPDFHVLK